MKMKWEGRHKNRKRRHGCHMRGQRVRQEDLDRISVMGASKDLRVHPVEAGESAGQHAAGCYRVVF